MTSRVLGSVVAGIVLAASACGGESSSRSEPVSASEVATKYGYDAASSALTPAFAIVPEFGDPRDLYARMLLLKECVKDVEAYTVLPPAADTNTTVFDPRTGDRRFTLTIAQTWGYQLSPEPDTVSAVVLDKSLTSEQIVKKEAECGKQTANLLGSAPNKLLTGIVEAGWAAVDTDGGASAAQEAWRACMMPLGVVDLPTTPREMPPPSVATVEAPSTTAKVASESEKATAIFDANCRESSGYDSAVRSARANGELAAIGKDLESFEAARLEYQKYWEGIEKVLQNYG